MQNKDVATARVERVKPGFDYADLSAEARIVVRQKTDEIRDRVKRAAQDIVAIGERLIVVKEQLEHGQFGAWLTSEFEWSESAALKMMQVATQFKSVNFTDLKIGPSALYLLASPSTPESVKRQVMKKAAAGKAITHAEVKSKVAAARKPKGKPASQADSQKPVDQKTPEPAAAPAVAPSPAPSATDLQTSIGRINADITKKAGAKGKTAEVAKPVAEYEPPTDAVGVPLPKNLRADFETVSAFRSLMKRLSDLKSEFKQMCGERGGQWAQRRRQTTLAHFDNLHAELRFAIPHGVCPSCGGRGCDDCKQVGFVPEEMYKALPDAIKPQPRGKGRAA